MVVSVNTLKRRIQVFVYMVEEIGLKTIVDRDVVYKRGY